MGPTASLSPFVKFTRSPFCQYLQYCTQPVDQLGECDDVLASTTTSSHSDHVKSMLLCTVYQSQYVLGLQPSRESVVNMLIIVLWTTRHTRLSNDAKHGFTPKRQEQLCYGFLLDVKTIVAAGEAFLYVKSVRGCRVFLFHSPGLRIPAMPQNSRIEDHTERGE